MTAKEAAAANGPNGVAYRYDEGRVQSFVQFFSLLYPESIFLQVDEWGENDDPRFQQMPSTPALLDLNDWKPFLEELPKRCRGPRGRKRAA
jgi:hypothetical protein